MSIDVSQNPVGSGRPFSFSKQTAATPNTARLPQDLTSFIAAGTITQAMLDDPNTLLRQHIASQKIVSTTTISISTNPASPLFGGGANNIAFLLGDPAALTNPQFARQNAQVVGVQATFWIETVQETVLVGPTKFPETVTFTQIQYSQEVLLSFNSLTWPHVSVATLAKPPVVVSPLVL